MLFLIIFIIAYISVALLMCRQESKKRNISFTAALLILIITSPIIGYFIISSFPLKPMKRNTVDYVTKMQRENCARHANKPGKAILLPEVLI